MAHSDVSGVVGRQKKINADLIYLGFGGSKTYAMREKEICRFVFHNR